KDPSKRFELEEEMLGPEVRFLKPNSIVEALIFTDEDDEDDDGPSTGSGQGGKIIGVKVPITVDLKVTEAFDAVKGDTATGGTKTVTLETGATVNVPLFVKQGDIIRINTENAEY